MKKLSMLLGVMIALIGLMTLNTVEAQVSNEVGVIHKVNGPCIPASGSAGVPAGCETDCVVYCTDFCSTIVWTAAGCENESGPCVRKPKNRDKETCRNCFCTWPFGGCVDKGTYKSGSTSVIDCG